MMGLILKYIIRLLLDMGVYLSEPIKTKKTQVETKSKIAYCSSEMQGNWSEK